MAQERGHAEYEEMKRELDEYKQKVRSLIKRVCFISDAFSSTTVNYMQTKSAFSAW